ncbi:MAG: VWA domain-containing protein [Bryobacteraceae bacterium]
MHILRAAIFIAAACVAQALEHDDREGEARFGAGVTLVRLEASVRVNDQPIEGLTAGDFVLLDNGVHQPIERLLSVSGPLEVILLVDVSGSMAKRGASIQVATDAALAAMQPGDRLCLMSFDTRAQVVVDFTPDVDLVRKTVKETVVPEDKRGGTRILEAVKQAAEQFLPRARSEAVRVILCVTENMGFRTIRQSTVLRSLWEADATVAAITIRNRADAVMTVYRRAGAPYMALLEAGIGGVVRETGGEMLPLRGRIDSAMAAVMQRLRQRYVLFHRPPSGAKCGEQRRVELRLADNALKTRKDAIVRTRRAYVRSCDSAGK